jgi:hypothetical protein
MAGRVAAASCLQIQLFGRPECFPENADGMTHYDPATKFEHVSTAKPEIKRRRTFQIRHEVLASVYHKSEVVDLVL